MDRQQIETVVIGGGQSGLALGYHLRRHGLPFLILDENDNVGDVWRKRWDSLRLFTPASYSGLPGMLFPGPPSAYPTKNQTAEYLAHYARTFELPIRTGMKVERVSAAGNGFQVITRDQVVCARNVVVATGAYHHPRMPSFTSRLDPSIVQLHSSAYRNPAQLREGPVLVVGAGNSGAEIAIELASDRRVYLSGPDTGEEPTRAGSVPDRFFTPVMWLVATQLKVTNPLGRKLRDHFLNPPRGIPLGRVRRKDLVAAGIERVLRTTGVRDGYPLLEGGRVLEVSNVIWCTGYAPDFKWVDLPIPVTSHGFPMQERGVVQSLPGLYFIGLLFLYSLSSALIGGVGRDARYIADHIARNRAGKKNRPEIQE